jgi:tetratricopeptide (TPR) repeat protein
MALNRSIALGLLAVWCVSLCVADDERQQWAEQIRAADEAYDRTDYRRSLDALIGALRTAEQVGSRDLPLALTLSRLGSVYLNLGRYREAEDVCLRALATWRQAAPADPDRSIVLVCLVTVYGRTGEFAKAEKFGRMAIEIEERAHGPESTDLGGPLQNLAAILQSEHRYVEAQQLYQRALHILEKGDRPNFAASAHSNLGLLLGEMGRPEDGIAEVQRAVSIWEAAFGRDHPRLVPGLTNLATLYSGRNSLSRFGRNKIALEISLRSIGSTAWSRYWIAAGKLDLSSSCATKASILSFRGRQVMIHHRVSLYRLVMICCPVTKQHRGQMIYRHRDPMTYRHWNPMMHYHPI